MYSYAAFGLNLKSEIQLPELPEQTDGAPDVVVRRGEVDASFPTFGENPEFAIGSEDKVEAFLEDIGRFVIESGKRLTVHPVASATDHELRLGILGAGLGVILQQRGILTLHASAVLVDGGVVAFVGNKGMGKSTTAAALYRRGHPLFTDDILAVRPSEQEGDSLMTIPGYSFLKLWPEAMEAALDKSSSDCARVHPAATKRLSTVRDGTQRRLAPLRKIYVLDYDEEQKEAAKSVPVVPQNAFRYLIAHSYAQVAFTEESRTMTQHLRSCSAILNQVPVRRLVRRPSLENLSALAEFIEAENSSADVSVAGAAPADGTTTTSPGIAEV